MAELTHEEIYKELCDWNPQFALGIMYYRPWGSTSIAVWHKSGFTYKIKRYGPNVFIMQTLSEDDIKKKFGLK